MGSNKIKQLNAAHGLLGAAAPDAKSRSASKEFALGLVDGDGVGAEVIGAATRVLATLEAIGPARFEILRCEAPIGYEAREKTGCDLPAEASAFFAACFRRQAPVLCGPGGGRFVYELRKEFDLYCKLVPLRPLLAMRQDGIFASGHLDAVDMLLVRDNIAGQYLGTCKEHGNDRDGDIVEQTSTYTQRQVERIVAVGARIARTRSGRMTVVIKEGGMPAFSALWMKVARFVAAAHGVHCDFINFDHAAYRMIKHPAEFDVIVAANLAGDVLGDLAATLLGSRGLSFSANFSSAGHAVYQTAHGAAMDIAGLNRANPAGQMLSLAMLLRESLELDHEAHLIETAIDDVLRGGFRPADVALPNRPTVTTTQFTEHVVESICRLAGQQVAIP